MYKNNCLNDEPQIIISAMIVARNSQDVIEMSLCSLINQDFPKRQYEILVIDGMSEDQTMERAEKMLSASNISYKILKNPKKNLAAGWNIGIQAARGEYVTRIDAHVWAYPDFLSKSFKTIQEVPDAWCVGGKAETVAVGKNGQMIVNILTSPFGVGNSVFRTSDVAQYADTAACGLYRKSVFEKVGFFEETLMRSQDTELHARITAAGGRFYFDPNIRLKYYARNTVAKLWRQGWSNGYWNICVWKHSKKALMLRHLIPLCFVVSLIANIALALWNLFFCYMLIIELLLYIFSGYYFLRQKDQSIFKTIETIGITFILHILYGLGSLKGLVSYFFI